MQDTSRTSNAVVSPDLARERARLDLNFLAALASPIHFRYLFPQFYLALFSILANSREFIEQIAIGIPRGFAKTTWIKLVCLWYILFSTKSFILIVSASEKKAISILSDICDMLDSPNIRILFGNWQSHIEVDQAATKVFNFRGRDIVLWAAGAGTSVRGINRKNSRPDVMIMDDIQDREDAKNAELAEELFAWMLSTLMMARSNDGCTYIFVGNMYPRNSILEKLKNHSEWKSFIVGGILEDGQSLWEELKPLKYLLSDYKSYEEAGHPEIFLSEVMNSTELPALSGLDLSKIPRIPEYFLTTEPEGSFILIDPSSGKKNGDDCTIEHFSICDEKVIFDELLSGTLSPLEVIRHSLELGVRRGTRLICVEDVAYQSTLLFWFEHVCRAEGIEGFEFQPVSPKNQAKNNRIKSGLIRMLKGETYLHPAVRSLVLDQAQAWDPLKINNTDDIIDPPGYVDEVLQKYRHLCVKQIFETDTLPRGSAYHSDSSVLTDTSF